MVQMVYGLRVCRGGSGPGALDLMGRFSFVEYLLPVFAQRLYSEFGDDEPDDLFDGDTARGDVRPVEVFASEEGALIEVQVRVAHLEPLCGVPVEG